MSTHKLTREFHAASDIGQSPTVDLLDFEDEPKSKEEKEELNILPQIEEDDDYDLQKELEAKFDELFGDDS